MDSPIFQGLKVIDCASFIAAPAAATVLSDFGADVIKIEPPHNGDPYRQLPQLPGNPKSSENYAWLLDSRNKRSLALDLAKPAAQAVLHTLVAQTDVFITNYPREVRRRLKLDYETLAPLNPRLVYASFTGYGEIGEEADKPAFDTTAWWARSGLMDLVRTEADAPPSRPVAGMGDHPSAMSLLAGILIGLYQRERTGKGTYVGSSLLANGVWANGYFAQAALCGATIINRPPRGRGFNALSSYYRCRDGRWLILTILNEDRQWPALAHALARADLLDDARFATKPQRLANSQALIRILDEAFATHDLAYWRDVLSANGLVFDMVAKVSEISRDDQMLANKVLVPFEDEAVLTVNSPLFVQGASKVQPRRAPDVGQHSEEILREAGYEDATLMELRASGVIV
jgi:crotonobetainyl-CoA:carnitine CoA-transferase CaiB-like acyl-CoA transferase